MIMSLDTDMVAVAEVRPGSLVVSKQRKRIYFVVWNVDIIGRRTCGNHRRELGVVDIEGILHRWQYHDFTTLAVVRSTGGDVDDSES